MPIKRNVRPKIKRQGDTLDSADIKKILQSHTLELRKLNTHLRTIEGQLKPKWFFVNGVLRGIGALVGATFLIIGVSYLLDVLGVFPVIGDAANALRELLDYAAGRRIEF